MRLCLALATLAAVAAACGSAENPLGAAYKARIICQEQGHLIGTPAFDECFARTTSALVDGSPGS
jgi:hypothetical protein